MTIRITGTPTTSDDTAGTPSETTYNERYDNNDHKGNRPAAQHRRQHDNTSGEQYTTTEHERQAAWIQRAARRHKQPARYQRRSATTAMGNK